ALLTRQLYRGAIHDLGRRVAALRDAPPAPALDAGADWEPLTAEVVALAASFRHAVDTVVKSQGLLSRLRGSGDPAGRERGHSHSSVHPGNSLRSGRLIARLTPAMQWTGATSALLRFLGRGAAELDGRSFLDCVPGDDVPALVAALQDALREGEAHN